MRDRAVDPTTREFIEKSIDLANRLGEEVRGATLSHVVCAFGMFLNASFEVGGFPVEKRLNVLDAIKEQIRIQAEARARRRLN